jgi:hypothetical protein
VPPGKHKPHLPPPPPFPRFPTIQRGDQHCFRGNREGFGESLDFRHQSRDAMAFKAGFATSLRWWRNMPCPGMIPPSHGDMSVRGDQQVHRSAHPPISNSLTYIQQRLMRLVSSRNAAIPLSPSRRGQLLRRGSVLFFPSNWIRRDRRFRRQIFRSWDIVWW